MSATRREPIPSAVEQRSPAQANGGEHRSSHDVEDGLEFAGWRRGRDGSFRRLLPARHPKASWLRPTVLWHSRNDILAKWFGDPTDGERARWIAGQMARGAPPDLTLREHADHSALSFMVLSDTGEGDASQMVVVPPLLKAGEGTEFAVICSDVIYPSGDVNEYLGKFYLPYQDYPGPIYALPGNHDWYDDLTSFMVHFCDAEPLAPAARVGGRLGREGLRRWLWRTPTAIDPAVKAAGRAMRPRRSSSPLQPGPYFAIEAGPLMVVGIDTGILGGIDAAQAAWLRQVASESPKPKILLTGKPLIVNGKRMPGVIAGEQATVDDIVRDPRNNFVAAIGGDIHNYQRYPVRLEDGRRIEYIVAGGGGAFMHATHHIPPIALDGVSEEDFRCYPLRGDSLAIYVNNFARRRRLRWLRIHPNVAAAAMADRLGLTPVRRDAAVAQAQGRVGFRARFGAWLFSNPPLPDRLFQRVFSEFLDWDKPPLFKSFLRVDVDQQEVRIRCFQATGWRRDEEDPPVEDEVRIALAQDDRRA